MRFMNCLPRDYICDSSIRMAFRSQADGGVLHVDVLGEIGETWFSDGVTADDVIPRIREFGGDEIKLTVNSPGGLVFDAVAIYYALADHKATVKADILGQAASAATVITAAADHVRIGETAEFMIHRAWAGVYAVGNADDIEAAAADVVASLRRVNDEIADVLAERSGQSIEDVHQWMIGDRDGTTFVGRDAVEKGFADEVIPKKAKPKKDASRATARSRDLHLVRLRYS